MTRLLRVGVIGLGNRWRRRFLPALRALRDEFEVQVVCDQVRERAVRVARQLGCAVSAGPSALVEHDDVEAVLLLDRQWYGLWPVELACRAGKPVFCGTAPETDGLHLAALCEKVRACPVPVVAGLGPRAAAGTARLRELLETRLGRPRVVTCDLVQPALPNYLPAGEDNLFGTAGTALLDWCVPLLGGVPTSVWAYGADGDRFVTLVLEFPGGQALRITRWRVAHACPRWRLRVSAEHGHARLDLPARLHWADEEGRHVLTLNPAAPVGVTLLRQFHEVLTLGRPAVASLEETCRALDWLRAAARSRELGQRVPLGT